MELFFLQAAFAMRSGFGVGITPNIRVARKSTCCVTVNMASCPERRHPARQPPRRRFLGIEVDIAADNTLRCLATIARLSDGGHRTEQARFFAKMAEMREGELAAHP
jgi:hypothetical protein